VRESINLISAKLDDMDNNAVKERKKLATDLGDLKNELEIVSDKVITLSRDLRKNEEELSSLFDKVGKVESSIKKVDTGLSKLKTKVDEIPISVPPESWFYPALLHNFSLKSTIKIFLLLIFI